MKNEDKYYKAVLARDHRFDGKFFVGVKTTGIYCRPICPAKPKRQNVEFFSNYLDAEKAGYRPCLRCRPESAPRSGAWIGKSAMVQRAIKVIHDAETLEFKEEEFAAKFGVSARHLRRVFVEEIGKTPKQLAAENRLNVARKLLVETGLSITDVAYAAGFDSIRRFNDAFKLRFKRSPSEIRKAKAVGSEGLKVTLSYRPPYDFQGLLRSYRNHAVGNLESFTDKKMTRIICFDSIVGSIHIEDDPKNSRLLVEIDFPDTHYIHMILAKVRSMFDLDSDPVIIANTLETDPKIKKLLRKRPGVRLPSGWDSFEVGIGTILGQLVSVAMGRRLVADLIELLGDEVSYGDRKIKMFPTPSKIATASLEGLKTTQKRKETLKAFAQAVEDKKVSLEPTQSLENFYHSLKSIKGIGPWTMEYMGLKSIRNTDSFPKTDLILARCLEQYSHQNINLMSPWRGYVAALMWLEFHS